MKIKQCLIMRLYCLIFLFSCDYSVTNGDSKRTDERNTENPSQPPQPASEMQPTETSSELEVVPKDILEQRYKNDAGVEVAYDHKAQIKQLVDLKNQGKELWLIIGRGNHETVQGFTQQPYKPLNVDGGKRVWVYGNIKANTLSKNNMPHLFIDFENDVHLKTVPDELFSGITFDAGVAHNWRSMSTASEHYFRMLKKNGKFFLEAGSNFHGIIKLPLAREEEFDKACKENQRTEGTFADGTKYCFDVLRGSYLLVLSGTHVLTEQEKFMILQKRQKPALRELIKVFTTCEYRRYYGGYRYPVAEYGDKTNYFECTK